MLLAGFTEDETNGEYGVIVTLQRQVHDYERDSSPVSPAAFKRFEFVSDWRELCRNAYPTLEEALRRVN